LPPAYLRISSGLGGTAPTFAIAQPLLVQEEVLGAVEVAIFRVPSPAEHTLLNEVRPLAALSLQVLTRNISTEELLARIQAQAQRLEQQKEAFTEQRELSGSR
jgi:hypothetical protein